VRIDAAADGAKNKPVKQSGGQTVKIHILGPLELWVGERYVDIPGPELRTVLAALLVRPGHVTSIPCLIEAVWGDDPPLTAAKAIRNQVSRLRRRLMAADVPAGLIETVPIGYRLTTPEWCRTDLGKFEYRVNQANQCLASGGPSVEAVNHLRAALHEWRGAAFSGFDSAVIEAAAQRLNERHRAAMEACFDLELFLGRHREVISDLTEIVARYPLWEYQAGQLMLALYHSGRQADALDVYRRVRVVLDTELGVVPTKELNLLRNRILRADPALLGDLPPPMRGARVMPGGK
jgi:DNA-binding SARP family transcriptional activator